MTFSVGSQHSLCFPPRYCHSLPAYWAVSPTSFIRFRMAGTMSIWSIPSALHSAWQVLQEIPNKFNQKWTRLRNTESEWPLPLLFLTPGDSSTHNQTLQKGPPEVGSELNPDPPQHGSLCTLDSFSPTGCFMVFPTWPKIYEWEGTGPDQLFQKV